MVCVQFYRNGGWLGSVDMPAAPSIGQDINRLKTTTEGNEVAGTIKQIVWDQTNDGFIYARAYLSGD